MFGLPQGDSNQIETFFLNSNQNECAVKCFEERYISNFDLTYIFYTIEDMINKCYCASYEYGDVDYDNQEVVHIMIDETYDSIGKSTSSNCLKNRK